MDRPTPPAPRMPPKPIELILDSLAEEEATEAANQCNAHADRYGLTRQCPATDEEQKTNTRLGFCGEIAVARHYGLPWHGGWVGKKGGPDVGFDWQIRTRSPNPAKQLYVRAGDRPDHRYILVKGDIPEFKMYGWAFGAEIFRANQITNMGGRNDGTNSRTFALPHEWLRCMSTIFHVDYVDYLAGDQE